MIGAYDDMNKGKDFTDKGNHDFLYIHITFYENYMIESLESRLMNNRYFSFIEAVNLEQTLTVQ